MKYLRIRFFYIFLLTLFVVACSKNNNGEAESEASTSIQQQADIFDSTRNTVYDSIKYFFANKTATNKDTIRSTNFPADLYKYNNYQPFWLYQERIEFFVIHALMD